MQLTEFMKKLSDQTCQPNKKIVLCGEALTTN